MIYAGEAHGQHLASWFLGDGTGCGKGRQVAGIILDNWLSGRKRAVWISKSDKLIEDAVRDWSALGGRSSDIVLLSRFKQGSDIRLEEGILFVTYATLRSAERQQGTELKASRLDQVVAWLGHDFDGVIAFDEAHAMANAAGEKAKEGNRGEKKASQQGLAGLKLQELVPDARVLYVSATGATVVGNLAYAARLGLWGTGDFPFATRERFVADMGVAQVVFKPDWKSHSKAAPFKRNDALLATMPKGIIACPGSGITENLIDKARRLGIPVKRIGS